MKKSKYFFGALLSLAVVAGITSPSVLSNCVKSSESTIKLEEAEMDGSVSVLSTTKSSSYTLTDEVLISLTSVNSTNTTCSFEFRISVDTDNHPDSNFYIGYFAEGNNYEAKIQYVAKNKSGSTLNGEVPINRTSNYGIGSYLGSTYITTSCDVELSYDYDIDLDSLKLVNFFKADIVKDEDGSTKSNLPILTNPLMADFINASTMKTNELSSFIDTSYISAATYSDFTAIKLNVKNYGKSIYTSLSSTLSKLYNQNESYIQSGAYYIRTRLVLGGSTSFEVVDKNDETHVYSTISTAVNVSKDDNSVIFLIEGLKANEIKNFTIKAASVSLDMFIVETSKTVARSSYSARFGTIDFRMQDILNKDGSIALAKVDTSKATNYNLIYSLITAAYVVIYIAGATIYYFYLKKKDKNSEFKVLKTKDFIKTNVLGFITVGSILYDFLYILNRSTSFKNSIAVYNPLDWLICLFSVMVICFGGYFIRYFYIDIKNKNEKKRRDKLNLNGDSSDDGIGIIKIKK